LLLQGEITLRNWQQFVPTLLIVLTTIIYIPLMLSDIMQQVRPRCTQAGRHKALLGQKTSPAMQASKA
jgi:hypothetical protein